MPVFSMEICIQAWLQRNNAEIVCISEENCLCPEK